MPKDFAEALKEKVQRPFIFGPIDYTGLDQPNFPAEMWNQGVLNNLKKSIYLPEGLCIHGYDITVKNKTLKRATTIVKHSRFLKNMVVYPVFPPEPEPVAAPEGDINAKTDDAE